MGFLRALRPGRAALALDLMEEVRSVLADRRVLTLINRRQVTARDFTQRSGGAVQMEDAVRKEVIVAYQKRKQEEVTQPVLDQKMPFGLVPHVQRGCSRVCCVAILKAIRRFVSIGNAMHVLISYDVSTETAAGLRRLRKVAQACQDFGQRVQKSMFEC